MKAFIYIFLLQGITFSLFGQDIKPPPYFLEFIEENPTKFHLTYNDNSGKVIKWRDNELSTVGGLVYWLYVLEYTRQVSNGTVKPNERVPLSEIQKFDASSNKMKFFHDYLHYKNKLLREKVRLSEIASGLIHFTTDANGDYLMSRLGMDSVQRAVGTFHMHNTTTLFPISSAMIHVHNPFQEDEKEFIHRIKNENLGEFREQVYQLYDSLNNDSLGVLKDSFVFDSEKHKTYAALLTGHMPMGIVSDFNILIQNINNRSNEVFWKEKMKEEWIKVVEKPLMEDPTMAKHYKHCGRLVYSTVNSVSISLYGTFKNGRTAQLTATFEDLTETEHIDLALSINDFGFSMIENREYLQKVIDKISLIRLKK
ncbi:hypothetical protein KMW28_06625 [Flammeovirga yaeyamensis]|uniref:Uncharacterized protein n=1 Tax=Flammeovirga yaeyamensis TaxID=367791 RepID=A0AAX1N9Y7_9BACT|nr:MULTISPECIES: hypothetical protein [Flammeovirga]ANQ49290.1 hypothetical protein MY04_1916 [Flammeovirga sp. MY04]MBB3697847.1 hypothetical protein [Flammeovirga yaeyamensis]NMF35797.1 hypothetical protein [Flammeovirga yaeyamensis]QWG03251.1 hypothetical protein KMW28_06625 [Flammeovirga yaeyamensis]